MGTSSQRRTGPDNDTIDNYNTLSLNETERWRIKAEQCPQYEEDNECPTSQAWAGEPQAPEAALPCPVLPFACGSRTAISRASLDRSKASRCQTAAALGYPDEAKCRSDSRRSIPQEERNNRQENPNRGRRKHMHPTNNLVDAALVEPSEWTLSQEKLPQPTSLSRDREASGCALCSVHDHRKHISALSRPSIPHLPSRFLFRSLGMDTVIRIADLTSLLFGYVLTITTVNSLHRHNPWPIDLPLMKQLPRSFTHPSPMMISLQFMSWSLIGTLHVLRSPRYWPECGLVANIISIAIGGWFGMRAMLDSLMITAFLSLLVAKAIEWAPKHRATASGREILPLFEKDCKH
ncbi:hypothetical protein B0T16DRAFT_237709 [Cercophora newfieldiana]|uniref:Uncharacterized protein n=1 Tax=Cercophora newfieldiana TaxID=92897 RepID=A0AA40CJ89_9PEZI|nr:hypothetical protein B0T16DRAFT_237709 [Cercophora newfieldiana]